MEQRAINPVFLRAASGLIKSAGTLDVFIYNVGLISIGAGVAITHYTGPAHYPGGNIAIASLIAAAVMTCVGAAYWLWTIILPRSGGTIGFALSFVESCCWLFYNAVAAVLISTVGIAPMFATLGFVTGNPRMNEIAKMLETPIAQFSFGAVVIVLSGILLILGMRRFFLVQKIMFAVALVGTALMLICLALYSHDTFVANFNRFMANLGPNAYGAVIQAAKKAGWSDVSFDWWQTVRLSVWPFLPMIGGAFSIAMIGILGAVISSGIVFALVGYLSYHSIGYDFQGAITYNADQVPAMSTPVKPYFTLMLGILTNNLIITALIAASFIAWIYFWIPGMLAYAERAMLAWSFDRLAPDSVGYVSDRYHTPVTAIVITVIVSIIFLALYVFTTFFATLIFILAAAIAWFITMVTGIFFPFKGKHIYEQSPVSRYKIAGIPVMSIVNLLAALALLLMIVLLWNDPLAAGHDARSLGTIIGVFGLGIVLYYVMRWWRRRKGIDVRLAFKEIPIE